MNPTGVTGMSFQTYLDSIEAKTGKTPNELMVLAMEKGYDSAARAGTIVDWLERDFDLGWGHAMALVRVIKRRPTVSGKHVSTTDPHRDESNALRLDGIAKPNSPVA